MIVWAEKGNSFVAMLYKVTPKAHTSVLLALTCLLAPVRTISGAKYFHEPSVLKTESSPSVKEALTPKSTRIASPYLLSITFSAFKSLWHMFDSQWQ